MGELVTSAHRRVLNEVVFVIVNCDTFFRGFRPFQLSHASVPSVNDFSSFSKRQFIVPIKLILARYHVTQSNPPSDHFKYLSRHQPSPLKPVSRLHVPPWSCPPSWWHVYWCFRCQLPASLSAVRARTVPESLRVRRVGSRNRFLSQFLFARDESRLHR